MVVLYKSQQQTVVISLAAVENIVGQVESNGKWGIIDWSSNIACIVFVDDKEREGEDI